MGGQLTRSPAFPNDDGRRSEPAISATVGHEAGTFVNPTTLNRQTCVEEEIVGIPAVSSLALGRARREMVQAPSSNCRNIAAPTARTNNLLYRLQLSSSTY